MSPARSARNSSVPTLAGNAANAASAVGLPEASDAIIPACPDPARADMMLPSCHGRRGRGRRAYHGPGMPDNRSRSPSRCK
jgi:hypothetical protein